VDDIIFGSTNEFLCEEFSNPMKSELEMTMMGEMNFFLNSRIVSRANMKDFMKCRIFPDQSFPAFFL